MNDDKLDEIEKRARSINWVDNMDEAEEKAKVFRWIAIAMVLMAAAIALGVAAVAAFVMTRGWLS